MFRFIHAADLHLDSPFKELRALNPEVGKKLLRATFDAYTKLIDLCIEKKVACLVVAGDVFDGIDQSLSGQLRFVDGLKRLNEHNIRAFICHGNHDPLDSWKAELSFPDNVHQFTENAESVLGKVDGTPRYRVYGVSYPTQEVKNSLLNKFKKSTWPEFTIGLLHANVGNNDGHESYAPCTVEELTELNYDYWALGHVHTRKILQNSNPWIGYPGNPQGRSPRETGARGVYVVEVEDDKRVTAEFVPVHTVRWEQREVDIEGLEEVTQLWDRLRETVDDIRENCGNHSVVYRIHLIGRGRVHQQLVETDTQDLLNQRSEGVHGDDDPFAWCAGVTTDTASAIDLDQLREGNDAVGDFLKLTKTLAQDETLVEDMKQELSKLFKKSLAAKKHLEELVKTPQDAKRLLEKAESTALDLLVTEDPDLSS